MTRENPSGQPQCDELIAAAASASGIEGAPTDSGVQTAGEGAAGQAGAAAYTGNLSGGAATSTSDSKSSSRSVVKNPGKSDQDLKKPSQ